LTLVSSQDSGSSSAGSNMRSGSTVRSAQRPDQRDLCSAFGESQPYPGYPPRLHPHRKMASWLRTAESLLDVYLTRAAVGRSVQLSLQNGLAPVHSKPPATRSKRTSRTPPLSRAWNLSSDCFVLLKPSREQDFEDERPQPVQSKPSEMVVNGRPRREVVGQKPPMTATFQDVEDGVENIAQGVGARSSLGIRRG
jgi:hypothetical protein